MAGWMTRARPGRDRRPLDQLRALEPETVAITLLNSSANPAHEPAAGRRTVAALPGVPVCISAEVSPEIREYERTSTTVLNALLMPVVQSYLTQLAARMAAQGMTARLLLVQSNGGVCTAEVAGAQPVRLLLSGPSGGALAALRTAERLERPNLVGIDMGGTSFDVCVVQDGAGRADDAGRDRRPAGAAADDRDPHHRRRRRLDRGGGSGGRLTVGPRSAGARPGPVCYGRGGTLPTVTDANLVLGRLDAAFFLGGAMALDLPGARAAIDDACGGSRWAWASRRRRSAC